MITIKKQFLVTVEINVEDKRVVDSVIKRILATGLPRSGVLSYHRAFGKFDYRIVKTENVEKKIPHKEDADIEMNRLQKVINKPN